MLLVVMMGSVIGLLHNLFGSSLSGANRKSSSVAFHRASRGGVWNTANRQVLCTWLVACLGHVAAIAYYGQEISILFRNTTRLETLESYGAQGFFRETSMELQ